MGKALRILATLTLMSLFIPSAWAFADDEADVPEGDVATAAPEASDELAPTGDSQSTETDKVSDPAGGKSPSVSQPVTALPDPAAADAKEGSSVDDTGKTSAAEGNFADSELYGAYATATPVDGSNLNIPTVVEDHSKDGQPVASLFVEQPDEVASLVGSAIDDDDIPLGAFDEPVSPVVWVSSLGILATLSYALMVMSRRFAHIDRLRAQEQALLGYDNSAEDAESAQITVKCAG